MDDAGDDAIDFALSTRRMPHGRTPNGRGRSGRNKGSAAAKPFNPLRALGTYEITLGKTQRQTASGPDAKHKDQHSWLEIHELTQNEDGLLATFRFVGLMSGILILAGSRKVLANIIQDLETKEDGDDDSEQEDTATDEDPSVLDEQGVEREESEEDEDIAEARPAKSEIEREDERIRRRYEAFEKNSFKNPKFWFRWKAELGGADPDHMKEHEDRRFEVNTGYLIFTSNDCDHFDATISSSYHGWKDFKMVGRKTRPQATACPLSWNDVGTEDDEQTREGEETSDDHAALET